MRALDYLRIANKDILRQPVRSTLTVAALAISTVILVTLLAISISARQTIIQQLGLNNSLNSIVVTPNQNVGMSLLGGTVQVANEATATLNDAAVQQLGGLNHVISADPRAGIWEFKKFSVDGIDKTFVAQANGITTNNRNITSISAGKLFDGTSLEHEVVLGLAYAKELGYEQNPAALVGKTITITTQDGYRGDGASIPGVRSTQQQYEDFNNTPTQLTATIVGVSGQGTTENQLLVPMAWARQVKTVQTYNGQGVLESTDQLAENGYSAIVVQADASKNVQLVTDQLTQLGFGFISTQQQINRINGISAIMWGVLGAIGLVSLITACLGIVNTMLTTISEQKYAIGVWRAVGARKRTIGLRFIVQAIILGLIGGVIGAAIGWGISQYANRYISELLKAQNLPAMDVVNASPKLLAASVILTVLFGAIAGLYPAWRAARQDPSRALSSQ